MSGQWLDPTEHEHERLARLERIVADPATPPAARRAAEEQLETAVEGWREEESVSSLRYGY